MDVNIRLSKISMTTLHQLLHFLQNDEDLELDSIHIQNVTAEEEGILKKMLLFETENEELDTKEFLTELLKKITIEKANSDNK